uniref:Uncharacterized LOC115372975 n=1 Tax=Myripristis murdjan TaxID=586833 RepID=A0A667XMV1_9TELE
MKDGAAAEKQTMVSRQDIFEEYVSYYRQAGSTELPQGSDAQVGMKAAQFLLREPEPRERFTSFPFYQIVMEGGEALGRDWTKHLAAFMKASEFLERLCVNLFLQPWKKEFKTLKTFTGPFVYHLLPVLTTSTIDSVLASIGYLPHTDTQLRLREDANPNTAMLVGFELLLARVECRSLLEFLEQNQPGLQVIPEIRVLQPCATDSQTPLETSAGCYPDLVCLLQTMIVLLLFLQLPLSLEATPAVKPQPKPLQNHYSEDKSIIEMHRNYPDLAIRGRPLIQDKTQRASNSRDSTKALQITSKNNDANSSKAGTLVYSLQNTTPPRAEAPSLTSMEEEQELNKLAERMGQLSVLHKLRNTVEENPPQVLLGHGTSQLDGGILKQQKQPTLCHPSLQTICNVSDCQTCKGGAGIVGWEGEKRHERDGERGGGEDEHLAQSYIIVEHKKK